jgi:hypothetical protein
MSPGWFGRHLSVSIGAVQPEVAKRVTGAVGYRCPRVGFTCRSRVKKGRAG